VGVVIRAARAEDHAAFARLFVELAVDDPVPDAARWAQLLAPSSIIAEDAASGAVLGYAYFQVLRGSGYVRHVVSAPEARGRGVGRALMDAVAARCRAGGARAWCLNVKPENVAARALYERVGLRPAYPSAALRVPWSAVDAEALPAAADGVRAAPVAAEDDAEVERVMPLPAGLLAELRGRGEVLVALREGAGRGAIVGVASCDPSFPRCFPCKVARPELIGALLRAVRPAVPADKVGIHVAIENDEPTVDALLAAGAELRMRILHYRGPL
jgi:ribosomal protein S18 acetylase RimI-like enzyme